MPGSATGCTLKRYLPVAAIAVALALIGVIYYVLDPSEGMWLLKCPFRLITGLECPSCGSQRALHALLHGEFGAALRFNPFLLLSIPYLLLVIWGSVSWWPGSARVRRFSHSRAAILTYVVLFFLWWIIRNIV